MKIAQVVCILPPLSGGIGMVAHSYADQLFELGHDVTVFVPDLGEPKMAEKRYKVKILKPFMQMGLGAVLPQLLWRLGEFDVIHLHYPFFGAAHFSVMAKRLRRSGPRLVVSYHMDTRADGLKGAYFVWHRQHASAFILNNADKIIVSSIDYIENSDIGDYYRENENKFLELPFGVPRFFQPSRKDPKLMKKYGLSPTDTVIGFVGGLDTAHYFKGVDHLIRAISLLPDKNVKALIVGCGNLKESYGRLAQELNIPARVKFSGYVSGEDLPAHYNLFDIFTLPSINRAEAFGLVLIEAMSCGKPCIASNLKGVRSLIVTGKTGLLAEPANNRDLADKISWLLGNPLLMKQMSAEAVRSVDEKYRWSGIVRKLVDVYQNLLKKAK